MAKKKKKDEVPSREDAALDRILEATNTLLERAGSDPSGRYLRRLDESAKGLEAIVGALPAK